MTKLNHSEDGFTLIELIVVILIIAILAAIALPNFIAQADRAQDATAKANARSVVTHVEACYTSSTDYRQCTTGAQLGAGVGIPFGPNPGEVTIVSNDVDGYEVKAKSPTGSWYAMTKVSGNWAVSRSCGTTSGSDNPSCKAGKW